MVRYFFVCLLCSISLLCSCDKINVENHSVPIESITTGKTWRLKYYQHYNEASNNTKVVPSLALHYYHGPLICSLGDTLIQAGDSVHATTEVHNWTFVFSSSNKAETRGGEYPTVVNRTYSYPNTQLCCLGCDTKTVPLVGSAQNVSVEFSRIGNQMTLPALENDVREWIIAYPSQNSCTFNVQYHTTSNLVELSHGPSSDKKSWFFDVQDN